MSRYGAHVTERESDVPAGPVAGEVTEPRWLDADERAAWLSLVRMMIKLPSALDAQLNRDADLTHYEYMVLAMLSEQAHRQLRMSQLAAMTSGSLSRLSHVVKRLEKQDYVRRESDPEDGRYTVAILNPAGWAKVVASAPGHVAAVRELVIDALTPAQLRQLRDVGQQVLSRVDPEGSYPPE